MTFDLTPEQRQLIADASSGTVPAGALDAVLVIEERVRLAGQSVAQFIDEEGDRMRARLLAAASALGIGHAAIANALEAMKANRVVAGPDTTVPHWAVADGATEVEAARLLTYAAAQALDRQEPAEHLIARALELASKAAQHAVDAATRVAGPGALGNGALLDRLSRDARMLTVILR